MKAKHYVGIAIIVVLVVGLVFGIYWNVKDAQQTKLKNSVYYGTYYYSKFNTENNLCLGIKFYEDGTSYLSAFDAKHNEIKDNETYSKKQCTWSFKNSKEILLKNNDKEDIIKILAKDKITIVGMDKFGEFSILKS